MIGRGEMLLFTTSPAEREYSTVAQVNTNINSSVRSIVPNPKIFPRHYNFFLISDFQNELCQNSLQFEILSKHILK